MPMYVKCMYLGLKSWVYSLSRVVAFVVIVATVSFSFNFVKMCHKNYRWSFFSPYMHVFTVA